MSLYVPYYRPYNKHNTNIHVPGGIRTHNPSKRAAVDPRLRPRGHWDRQQIFYCLQYSQSVPARPSGMSSLGQGTTLGGEEGK
jgi:hypothetical protein